MASYNLDSRAPKSNQRNKIVGIIMLVVCSIAFVALFTNLIGFLRYFLLGIMGLFAYPFFLTMFVVGIALINNRRYVMSKKYIFYLCGAIVCLLAILNLIILGKPDVNYFGYLGLSYTHQLTAGGFIIGFLVAPFVMLLGLAGALVLFSVGLIVFIALIADYLYYCKTNPAKVLKPKEERLKVAPVQIQENTPEPAPVDEDQKVVPERENFELFMNSQAEKNLLAKQKLGLVEGFVEEDNTEKKELSLKEHLLTPPKIDLSRYKDENSYKNITKTQEINDNLEQLRHEASQKPNEPLIGFNGQVNKPQISEAEKFLDEILGKTPEPTPEQPLSPPPLPVQPIEPKVEEKPIVEEKKNKERKFVQFQIVGTEPRPPVEPPKNVYRKPPTYSRPPLDLLDNITVDLSSLNEDVVGKREKLEVVLEEFNIPAKVIGVVVGPAVTRYELEMPPGITVKKVVAHADDIALALAAKGGIRIEAPIPGRSAVGIEVPNDKIATVGLKDIINSREFYSSKSPLTFALGKDISGAVRVCNLLKMPHLLVAGATNSGKSVCLNSIIISLIYKTSPEDLRLILVDPKRVEFTMYNDLPHLMLPNVITEADKALNAFNWAIKEMERRYTLFQNTRTRNIDEYNNREEIVTGAEKKMPYIVIIVDELADLMITAKKELEEKIMRIAQKARASGIHLVLATQRPSVDVITGTIKSNLPSRIAFAVSSFADSKTILDASGAENLLGRGDMLYAPVDASEPSRIQGCYVSGEEVMRIVDFVKDNNPADFDSDTEDQILNGGKSSSAVGGAGEDLDPMLPQALKMFIETGQASISVIQRRFLVGYPRAARIVDQMERAGYISASDGSKPRSVFITMEEFNNIFGDV